MIALVALLACGEPPAPVEPDAPAPAQPTGVAPPAALPATFGLGTPATPEQIAALDVEVNSSWEGLPPGHGSVAEGKALFAAKCAACHGADGKAGQGFTGPVLVGTEPVEGFEKDWKIPHTIGNWWPHASSLWDYVYRSMPQTAPGSLTTDETYALVAFLLAENHAVPADFVADQDTIKTVKMPTKARWVREQP